MRRNRKIKKSSVLSSSTWWVVALIVSALIVAMGYYVLDSQCDQIARDIGKLEKRFTAVESECVREAARWEEMKIREHLEERLVRFGLEMRYARHDQIVHMDADGRPMRRSSATIARATARAKATDLALNAPAPQVRPAAVRRSTAKRVSPGAASKRTVRR